MTDPDAKWSRRRLAIVLYPFTVTAIAINLFMLSLLGQAIGLAALSPIVALVISVPLGIPATWMAGRWVRGLMDRADGS